MKAPVSSPTYVRDPALLVPLVEVGVSRSGSGETAVVTVVTVAVTRGVSWVLSSHLAGVAAAGCFRFVEPGRDSMRTNEKARTGLPSSEYGFDTRRPLRVIARSRAHGGASAHHVPR